MSFGLDFKLLTPPVVHRKQHTQHEWCVEAMKPVILIDAYNDKLCEYASRFCGLVTFSGVLYTL